MESFFVELALILVISLVIALLMRILKQPPIIGYILAGILVGPLFLDLLKETDTVVMFSQIGITFLLFIVGLHLNPRVIKEIGSVAIITGIGQIVFTSIVGFLISKLLGFPLITSIYISIALTLSSTIIVTKLLSDKGDLDALYGKISIGFLIVQDIFAAFLLILLPSLNSNLDLFSLGVSILIKAFISIFILIILTIYVLKPITKNIAKTQELLFIFSIAWCFIISAIFYTIGFSVEIGALVAGISLSLTPYSLEISSKIRPIRDFFIVMFFIFIGLQIQIENISSIIFPIIIFSVFVLIGNPLILMILMGTLGYTKRTGFLTGLTVAQVSEFSLILITLGISLNHLSNEVLPIIAFVFLITVAGSSYMLIYSEKLYISLSRYLKIFEKKSNLRDKKYIIKNFDFDVILFGYNRIGYTLLKSLKKINKSFLVVDYNPDTISKLNNYNINCIYGDADDSDFLDEIPFNVTKMLLSTIPNKETNLLIIEKIRKKNKNAVIIVIAHQINEAIELYEKGATYVLMPHFLGGEYASSIIEKNKFNLNKYEVIKKDHIKHLEERIKEGHEHPRKEF